jgi:hypothetical protein
MVKEPILIIDKPKFVVKLHEDMLEVDLKEGAKKELEDVIEAHPSLRKTLGYALQTVIPSDVELCEIDFVKVDDKGQLKIVILQHKDILLPLEPDESKRLAEKLDELVPFAKTKKKAKRRRLALHLWWPDYYRHVVVSGLH